ncbi:phospholipase D-like domain-containing protein [Marmoricola sp. URHB0036]|uniref:phospholipase D family protein n=1 Tax=Marmoricola sp. URHB0036 TaxID=1298863 RepID=UPI00040892C1|nr:phospholipase D-like domain-containing protein [Marmoricola sp. URHB0036]
MRHTDWLLSTSERANAQTRLDDRHPGETAWSEGNLVRTLVHGSTYFAELYERIEAARPGDLVLFTDWQGDADEQLTGEPGSEVVEVLGRADERGVDVRGLIWRSHMEMLNFSAEENRLLGRQLQSRGAEALLDMRVRTGGSHHQKLVVIRYRDRPEDDIAYVGGIDLCHSRRDDAEHLGDPQALEMAPEYGETPPWHDVMAAISGPAVYDVETVFRERWEDPTRLTRHPLYWTQDKLLRMDMSPDPLPEQAPPPPSPEGATHVVQLLRTYPNLRRGRDYPFARGGERSVARGYTKAVSKAEKLIYVEDQYLWGHHVGDLFTEALHRHPDLRVVAVVPLFTDQAGFMARTPQLLGRVRAMRQMQQAAPDRVAMYGIENHRSTPVYVHAKVCLIDDTWATTGSDNFNRRSWTHDSELTAAVVDPSADDHSPYVRRLRLALAAEHLDREVDDESLLEVMGDCVDAEGMFAAYAETARRLDDWHANGQVGQRPPGRLRRLQEPQLGPLTRAAARIPYLLLHDPDGRPKPLRKQDGY